MLGTTWRTMLRFPVISRPGFMIITPSFSPFSVLFSNGRFSNCSSTEDAGFVKLSSDCFVETWSSRWLLSSAITFASVVLWFSDTILLNGDSFHLIWFSATVPLSWYVFPWFVCAVITLETAALNTPNKVAVVFTDAPAKRAPTVCPRRKSDKPPILQYFHTSCSLILALHSVNKQKNSEI